MLRDVRDNEITDHLAGRAAINDKLCNNKEGITKVILSMLQGKKTLTFKNVHITDACQGVIKGSGQSLK